MRRFKQAGIQTLVNLHRGADDFVSDLVVYHGPGQSEERNLTQRTQRTAEKTIPWRYALVV